MFKYLAFAFFDHYPQGGMDDCILATNDIQEAIKALEESVYNDNKNIYITETNVLLSLEEAKDNLGL